MKKILVLLTMVMLAGSTWAGGSEVIIAASDSCTLIVDAQLPPGTHLAENEYAYAKVEIKSASGQPLFVPNNKAKFRAKIAPQTSPLRVTIPLTGTPGSDTWHVLADVKYCSDGSAMCFPGKLNWKLSVTASPEAASGEIHLQGQLPALDQ